ncbi:S41 family peptidase [Christiangramia forsetii]|uniref:Peptidase, family S41 n=2 Tax=Christiangramia forsetii TaxID=411153 RepID=A0M0B6_CHRFK|nr:S41 family peptidase [Christiangramia forsetii]GGG41332.1 hypothetical protein GCM10011532_26320 [Christiangramia forsetii]CAL66061.1 peptidase, family S41 [Christiangramia forsetii KT0803]
MKIYNYLMLFVLAGGLFTSCDKNDDTIDEIDDSTTGVEQTLELEIKNFEYEAMDIWYLYKDEIPEYNDDFFANQEELNVWLDEFDSPESLFYDGLVYQYEVVDEFSWIVDDYEALENRFAGVSTGTGLDYGLSRYCTGCDEVLGYVRYVIPNTPAAEAGFERGMVFTEIDGQQITVSNFQTLLAPETLTFGLGEIGEGDIVSTDQTITVTKATINENPVHVAKTLNVDGIKVGYLMYNSFTADYDDELNEAFAQFQADGITELVLDLRYNGGGRVSSAVALASMITGQFENEVIIRTRYNSFLESQFDEDDKVTRFNSKLNNGAQVNSLNLNKVYVLATGSSASASELIINGLAPYIDVEHIGTKTVGKVQASVTLYDAEFPYTNKNRINTEHKYALQPLISTSVNADGNAFPEGLIPDIEQQEFISTYGTLGDPSEPLLAVALNEISPGSTRSALEFSKAYMPVRLVSEKGAESPDYQKMYVDEVSLPKLKQKNN